MSKVGILDPSQRSIVNSFFFTNPESIAPRNEASHSGAGCLLSQADAIAASHGCGHVHQPGRGEAEELRVTRSAHLFSSTERNVSFQNFLFILSISFTFDVFFHYLQVAFFHKRTRSLLVTDAVTYINSTSEDWMTRRGTS